MYKIDFAYKEDTLYVYLKDKVTDKTIGKLKKDLYHAIDEYGITEVIIHVAEAKYLERETFCELLDDYDIVYGGTIHVVDSVHAIV